VKMLSRFRRPGASSVIAATVVLALVAFILLSTLGGSSGVTISSLPGNHRITKGELASLPLGSSRKDVERRFGKGMDALSFGALGFGETGVAVEPMDADCIYYGRAQVKDLHALVQLCFRHDKLVSKQTFPAIPGGSLGS
jgi:hypothetical protein